MPNPMAAQAIAMTADMDAEATPLLFRGLAFALIGSLVPWGLLAYYLL